MRTCTLVTENISARRAAAVLVSGFALLAVPAFADVTVTTSLSNFTFQAFKANGEVSLDGVQFGLDYDPTSIGTYARTVSNSTDNFSFDPDFGTVGSSFSNVLSNASASVVGTSFFSLGSFSTTGYTAGGGAWFTAVASTPRGAAFGSGYTAIPFTFVGNTTSLVVTATASYSVFLTGGDAQESGQAATLLGGSRLGVGIGYSGPSATVTTPWDPVTRRYLPNSASFSGQVVLNLERTSGDLNTSAFGIATYSSGSSMISPVPEPSTSLLFAIGVFTLIGRSTWQNQFATFGRRKRGF